MTRWHPSRWRWQELRPGSIGRERVFLAVKAGAAAGLAWWAAGAADGSVTPFFAPLAVLLVVQPTVHDSLSRAVQRVVGVTIGVIVALLVGHFVGLSAWSIAGVAAVGLLLGWLLRLGPQGVVQIPVSVLLVLAVGSATPGYAWARIVDTLIGAGIGVLAVLLSPSAPSNEDLTALTTEPLDRLVGVLRAAGAGIAGQWSRPVAEEWFAEASAAVDDVVDRRRRLAAHKMGARWNARASRFRPTLHRTEEALGTIRRMAIQTRGVTRGLAEGAVDGPPRSLPGLGALLVALADATAAYAGWLRSDDEAERRAVFASGVDRAGEALRASLERASSRWGDDAALWLSYGVVLASAQRILADLGDVLDPQAAEVE